ARRHRASGDDRVWQQHPFRRRSGGHRACRRARRAVVGALDAPRRIRSGRRLAHRGEDHPRISRRHHRALSMKLLILSQYYDPEPVPKAGELARAMTARGHDVAVVTGFPNYPSGVLYPQYRLALRSEERIDGIPVTRTFEYPYHGKSVLGRLINYG